MNLDKLGKLIDLRKIKKLGALMHFSCLKSVMKSYVFKTFGVLLLMLTVSNSQFLMGNTFYSVSHDPFDGLVAPVVSTVDWVNLPISQHKSLYHEINDEYRTPLPLYDANVLKASLLDVGFKSDDDLLIRNTKISYSVPYLGNYRFDGLENAGSHPGVDLKILANTPLLAIANGVVIKAVKSNIGMGNYIILLHKGVPDPDSPSNKIDIYSTYGHLDRILVEEGHKVSKGDLIAYSGDSGLTTGAHLDFQINTSDVPFLPYWPFNVNEIANDGLDFVSAINSGIGFDDAQKYTINPFEYIQEFGSYTWSTTVLTSEIDRFRIDESVAMVTEVDEILEVEPEVYLESDLELESQEEESTLNFNTIDVPAQITYIEDNTLYISYQGNFDPNKLVIKSSRIDVQEYELDSSSVRYNFRANNFGEDLVSIYYAGDLIHETKVYISIFKDVAFDSLENVFLKELYDDGLISGYSDGTIDLNSLITKAEALVLISRLTHPDLVKSSTSWFDAELQNAVKLGAVNDPDTVFANINVLEFLKMMYVLLDVDISMSVHAFYANLFEVDQWYSPYLQEAYRKNILSSADFSSIGNTLTRGDVLRLIQEFSALIQ